MADVKITARKNGPYRVVSVAQARGGPRGVCIPVISQLGDRLVTDVLAAPRAADDRAGDRAVQRRDELLPEASGQVRRSLLGDRVRYMVVEQ